MNKKLVLLAFLGDTLLLWVLANVVAFVLSWSYFPLVYAAVVEAALYGAFFLVKRR